jgi:hypothetical protein
MEPRARVDRDELAAQLSGYRPRHFCSPDTTPMVRRGRVGMDGVDQVCDQSVSLRMEWRMRRERPDNDQLTGESALRRPSLPAVVFPLKPRPARSAHSPFVIASGSAGT